jgi:hypothetical protein
MVSIGPAVLVDPLSEAQLAKLDAFLLEPNGVHVKLRREREVRAIEPSHLRAWMHVRARYLLPTEELAEWLATELCASGSRLDGPTIEVGAGSGDLCHHLGIPGTDSYFQKTDQKARLLYQLSGQPTVTYGPNVEKLDAIRAAKKYKPHTIVAAWVTQKCSERDPVGQGCWGGVDEMHLRNLCKRYIFIGNESSHWHKRILKDPHYIVSPCPPMVSRGNSETDRIWIWERA